jgi:dihydroorotate dehydrogenase
MRLDWRGLVYAAARPILFRFDPERIHRLTIRLLSGMGAHAAGRAITAAAGGVHHSDGTAVELLGLRFRNRIGVGAGFDKDAIALGGWAALGLGFAEVGTVTPRPQPGNPRPRLYRLPMDEALINRMGFNNDGAAALSRRVMLARRHLPAGFVVGVNIGRAAATDTSRAAEDYLACHRLVAPVADYLAINVSSPNTPNLRDLQSVEALADLLARLDTAGAASGARPPLFVKLAPDLAPAELELLVTGLLDTPAAGIILANTTTMRDALRSPSELVAEAGGLSGAPLLPGTLKRVERARELAGARLVIIASGGIGSADATRAALDAGADLVQLWTGLVYRGPGLIGEAVRAST